MFAFLWHLLQIYRKPEANFSERQKSQYKCDLSKKCSSKEGENAIETAAEIKDVHIPNGTLEQYYTYLISNLRIVIIDNLLSIYQAYS